MSKLSVLLTGNNAELKRVLDDSAQQMRRFGMSTQRVGQQMARNISLPLGLLGAASLKVGADFQSSMNQVRGVTQSTGLEFESLTKQAQEMGASTAFSATQAADAQRFLGMAGFETAQILSALPATLRLAAAGTLDLATSADIASNILSGYRLDVSELGRATDVLAKTFTSSNTDLIQLGDAFKMAGPIAAAAGVEFEQTAAMIGLLGNAGIQGTMAGTSLRGALSALLNPSKEVSDRLRTLGVSTKDATGQLRPLEEIIGQLEVAGADAGDMMGLFGQRAGPAMAAVVGQGSEALAKLAEELRNSGGSAAALADIQMQGLSGAFKELKSASEAALIGLSAGGPMTAAEAGVRGLAGAGREAAEAFQKVPDAMKLAGFAIGGLAVATAPVLVGLGKLLAMAPAIKTLFVAGLTALASPAAVLLATAGALAFTATVLAKNWTEAKLQFTLAWTAMKGAAFDAFGGILQGLARVAGFIPGVGDRIKELSATFDSFADESMAKSGRRIAELEAEIANGFNPAVRDAADEMGKLAQATRDTLDTLELQKSIAAGMEELGIPDTDRARAELAAYRAALESLLRQGLEPSDERVQSLALNIKRLSDELGSGATVAIDGIAGAFAQLNLQLRLVGGLTSLGEAFALPEVDEGRARLQAYQAALQSLLSEGLDPSDQRVRDLAMSIAELHEEMTDAAIDAERLKKLEQARQQVLEDIQTPSAAYNEQLELLNLLMKEGLINGEQFTLAVEAAGEAYAEATEKADAAGESWGKSFAATTAAIVARSEGDFGKMADDMINHLKRIAIEWAAMQIFEGLLSGLTGGLGGSLFGGARAAGGPVETGRAYLVGERGRELFVPSSQGNIVPNHALARVGAAGGGAAVNLTVNVPPARDPISWSRDHDWQRALRESMRVAQVQGFRPG